MNETTPRIGDLVMISVRIGYNTLPTIKITVDPSYESFTLKWLHIGDYVCVVIDVNHVLNDLRWSVLGRQLPSALLVGVIDAITNESFVVPHCSSWTYSHIESLTGIER